MAYSTHDGKGYHCHYFYFDVGMIDFPKFIEGRILMFKSLFLSRPPTKNLAVAIIFAGSHTIARRQSTETSISSRKSCATCLRLCGQPGELVL